MILEKLIRTQTWFELNTDKITDSGLKVAAMNTSIDYCTQSMILWLEHSHFCDLWWILAYHYHALTDWMRYCARCNIWIGYLSGGSRSLPYTYTGFLLIAGNRLFFPAVKPKVTGCCFGGKKKKYIFIYFIIFFILLIGI